MNNGNISMENTGGCTGLSGDNVKMSGGNINIITTKDSNNRSYATGIDSNRIEFAGGTISLNSERYACGLHGEEDNDNIKMKDGNIYIISGLEGSGIYSMSNNTVLSGGLIEIDAYNDAYGLSTVGDAQL